MALSISIAHGMNTGLDSEVSPRIRLLFDISGIDFVMKFNEYSTWPSKVPQLTKLAFRGGRWGWGRGIDRYGHKIAVNCTTESAFAYMGK